MRYSSCVLLGILLFCPFVASSPAIADCIDYGQYMHWERMVDLPDWGMDVSMYGTWAVVALNLDWTDGELRVVDVADPENPRVVGRVDLGAPAMNVRVTGHYACVLGEAALWVVDLADPQNPVLRGACGITGGYSLAASGTYAYAHAMPGLVVIDIADPDHPRPIGEVPFSAWIEGIDASGTNVYVAETSSLTSSLYVIDAADPRNPRVIGVLGPMEGVSRDVVVSGAYAYLVGETLISIDISNPEHPVRLGVAVLDTGAERAVVSGDHVFVVGGGGLESVDVTDPEHPRPMGRTWMGGVGVAILGTHALVADGSGLHLIDVANQEAAPVVAQLQVSLSDLALQGTHIYATSFSGRGFTVIDVADPRDPWIAGTLELEFGAYCLSVAGPYAYVLGQFLNVIDIQDPAHPRVVGSVASDGSYDVALSGHCAYVAGYDHGLGVFNINDPEHPTFLGYVSTPGYTVRVETAGSKAYILDLPGGLFIADVSIPESPRIIGNLHLYDARVSVPGCLAVSGNLVYIGTNSSPASLLVVDVSDPQNPRLVGTLKTFNPCGVAVTGTTVYLATDVGLQVIDASDPARPRIIGDSEIPGPSSLVMSESEVYISDVFYDGHCLRVLDLQCEGTSGIAARGDSPRAPGLRIYPNPTKERAEIRLAVGRDGWASALISDVTGRRVRLLHDGALTAGPYEFLWDGRDDRGREVAPGSYFVRLTMAGRERTGRIVIVR